MQVTSSKIAQVCHEANRGYQTAFPNLGIPVAQPWDLLDGPTRAGIISGVEGILAGNTPEQSHEAWLARKESEGWTYGPNKDERAKTHPNMLPYLDLPESERRKDDLFASIVIALGASESWKRLTRGLGSHSEPQSADA